MPTAPSVGSDMGAGARPARGWVAAGAIEAVPSGARVRRCHALARGHFPRGAKGGVLREPANILVHGETALRRDGLMDQCVRGESIQVDGPRLDESLRGPPPHGFMPR